MKEPPPASSSTARVNVLGVGISALNLPLARDRIFEAITARRKGYVTITGVHGVMEAQDDPALKTIFNRSFLTTPDGMPMVWMGWCDGRHEMDRVYGPDLMLLLCDEGRERGVRHFFYGGNDGVAETLSERLQARFPGLEVAGCYTPPFRPLDAKEESNLEALLERTRPDLLWVGLSTPKQERFMAQYLERLPVPIMIGVGAAFDFHAGLTRQAPLWMQRSGLEWLYRLFQEPRRLWRRYLRNNPRFVLQSLLQKTGCRDFPMD